MYTSFKEDDQDSELTIDMYRSNDVVRLAKNSIYVRPFIKVGEDAEQVKVFQFQLIDVEKEKVLPRKRRVMGRRTLAHHKQSMDSSVSNSTTSSTVQQESCL